LFVKPLMGINQHSNTGPISNFIDLSNAYGQHMIIDIRHILGSVR